MKDGDEGSGPDQAAPARLDAGGVGLGGLDDIVGVHLRLAQAAAYRSFMERLAPVELTQKQIAVLWLIGENPGVSQIQLATTLNMDRATMMAIIDRLDARELLDRQRSKVDRRKQMLALTKAGEELLVRAKTIVAAHEDDLKERIGKRGLAEFVEALRRIYG